MQNGRQFFDPLVFFMPDGNSPVISIPANEGSHYLLVYRCCGDHYLRMIMAAFSLQRGLHNIQTDFLVHKLRRLIDS